MIAHLNPRAQCVHGPRSPAIAQVSGAPQKEHPGKPTRATRNAGTVNLPVLK
jgi:hypothetical protein